MLLCNRLSPILHLNHLWWARISLLQGECQKRSHRSFTIAQFSFKLWFPWRFWIWILSKVEIRCFLMILKVGLSRYTLVSDLPIRSSDEFDVVVVEPFRVLIIQRLPTERFVFVDQLIDEFPSVVWMIRIRWIVDYGKNRCLTFDLPCCHSLLRGKDSVLKVQIE